MTRDDRMDGLDPGRDPLEWDRAVEAIVRAAEPELRRRKSAAWILPDRWARPVFAAAASLILVACGSLLWTAAGSSTGTSGSRTEVGPAFTEALYPPVVARWLGGQMEPTVEDLVFATVGP
ncbi:MAG: hypothetical protein R3223_03180 [Longimicrobiales bacterium]|nr:hypothetical protein [Longimicrobiales bacterium]